MKFADLKQQLILPIEKNIIFLNALELCLESDKKVEHCIESYAETLNKFSSVESMENNNDLDLKKEQIKQDLKKRIVEDNKKNEIILQLKILIVEIENIKYCLNKAKVANDFQNCFVKYKTK